MQSWFHSLGGAVCACPGDKSPSVWGLHWARDFCKPPYPVGVYFRCMLLYTCFEHGTVVHASDW